MEFYMVSQGVLRESLHSLDDWVKVLGQFRTPQGERVHQYEVHILQDGERIEFPGGKEHWDFAGQKAEETNSGIFVRVPFLLWNQGRVILYCTQYLARKIRLEQESRQRHVRASLS
jgi:hypothetical protein